LNAWSVSNAFGVLQLDGYMDGWMRHLMSRGTIKWMAYIKCIWSAMDGWDTLGINM
jgi:hypothetical protein